MLITTDYIEDELFESRNEQNITTRVDMRSAEKKSAMSPMEMLLSALTSCVAVEVVSMLKKRRKTIQNMIIDAQGDRNETPPKYFKSIHLHFKVISPDAKEEEVDKLTKLTLEKYCSVGSSIKSDITYSSEIEAPGI